MALTPELTRWCSWRLSCKPYTCISTLFWVVVAFAVCHVCLCVARAEAVHLDSLPFWSAWEFISQCTYIPIDCNFGDRIDCVPGWKPSILPCTILNSILVVAHECICLCFGDVFPVSELFFKLAVLQTLSLQKQQSYNNCWAICTITKSKPEN